MFLNVLDNTQDHQSIIGVDIPEEMEKWVDQNPPGRENSKMISKGVQQNS